MLGRIGIQELVLVLAIALIIFGPRKLPEIGSALGKSIREFRQATSEVKKSISLDEDEPVKKSSPKKAASSSGAEDSAQGEQKDAPAEQEKTETETEEQGREV